MKGYIVNFIHPDRNFVAALAHIYSRQKKALCDTSFVTVFKTRKAARQAINSTIIDRRNWLKKNIHDGRCEDIYTKAGNYYIKRVKAA
jgi:hypothetical protein